MTKQKRLLTLIGLLLFAGIGAWLVFNTNAQERGLEPSHDYDANIDWNGKFDPNTVAVGDTLNVGIGVRLSNPLYNQPSQMRLIIFSDKDRVDFLGYTCSPMITCYVSTWDKQTAGYGGRKDALLCLSIPAAPIPGYPVGQHAEFVTMHYKMRDPVKAFWVELEHASGPGSCTSNPTATNVTYQGGYGSCVNYLPNSSERNCAGADASGIGYLDGGNGGFSGGIVGDLSGEEGSGDQQNNKTANTGSGGGGSSAKKQSDQTNSIPASSSQGNAEQPDLDPSPFYDGKEFKSGSDTDTLGSAITKTGSKLADSWPLVAGVILLGGVAGYGFWRWRHKG